MAVEMIMDIYGFETVIVAMQIVTTHIFFSFRNNDFRVTSPLRAYHMVSLSLHVFPFT